MDVAGPAAPEQLAQVVDRDDEHPLGLHRLEPPGAGTAEPAGLLDLAEDGLHDRLAPFVVGAARLGPQLDGHPSPGRESGRDPAPGCRRRLPAMVVAGECDIRIGAEGGEVVVG